MVHTRWFSILIILALYVGFVGDATFAASPPARQQPVERKVPQKADPVQAKPAPLPSIFSQGETLRFSATFNQIDAGRGEFQLRQERQTDGRDVFRFLGKAHTSELIDYLYKRRDTADAIFGVR